MRQKGTIALYYVTSIFCLLGIIASYVSIDNNIAPNGDRRAQAFIQTAVFVLGTVCLGITSIIGFKRKVNPFKMQGIMKLIFIIGLLEIVLFLGWLALYLIVYFSPGFGI